MSTRAIRLEQSGGPSTAEESARPAAAAPQPGQVRVASDDEVRKAIKRVTRDHEALIKALAK